MPEQPTDISFNRRRDIWNQANLGTPAFRVFYRFNICSLEAKLPRTALPSVQLLLEGTKEKHVPSCKDVGNQALQLDQTKMRKKKVRAKELEKFYPSSERG